MAGWFKTFFFSFKTTPVKTTVINLQYKARNKKNVVDLVYSILQNGTCSQDDLPQRTEGLRHFVTVLVFQGMKVNSFSHFAQTHKPTQKYPLNLQKGLKKIASSEYRDWPPGA